jgi:indolepyruvate ferredoxin oxidoreductase
VTSHVRIAPRPEDITAIRVAAGGADLILACDVLTAGTAKVLAGMAPGRTHVVVNAHETFPGEFTRNADLTLPTRRVLKEIEARAKSFRALEATRIATALLGDSIATNLFMLGLAWQHGLVPVGGEAILRAIELNAVDVAMNKAAFAWGRRAAVEPDAVVAEAARLGLRAAAPATETLDETIARRVAFLTAYQDAAYAARYAGLVARLREAERAVAPGSDALVSAVARNLFKLMAIKDEYEVARLYTDGSFLRQLGRDFSSWRRLEFHLAPPILGRRDERTGEAKKSRFGPWMMPAFRLLAALRGLRGTWLDPFGRTEERRSERRVLSDYEAALYLILEKLNAGNHLAGVALAAYPEKIRGYGHVKAAAVARVAPEAAALREAFLGARSRAAAAE